MREPITKYTTRGTLFQVALRAMTRELQMREMSTFVYCPRCNFELTSMNSATEGKNGLVFHVCKNCGAGSRWDYDAPTPINVT